MNRILYLVILVIGFGCNSEVKEQTTKQRPGVSDKPDSTELVINSEHQKDGLKIYPLGPSPDYRDARMVLQQPKPAATVAAGDVTFNFRMLGDSYDLGDQTSDADDKGIANSEDGQYIRLILNNNTYDNYTSSSFNKNLADGHYVAVAFLSRSYHESVKLAATAVQTFQFTVGNAKAKAINLSAPRLIYNYPQGNYVGEDAKKVLLDFYLLHTNLSESSKQVRVTINGKTEFMIANWQPYVLEGLPMGENKILLELVDKNGNLFGGKYNRMERTFTLGVAQ